jgi:chromosome segregation ATPase
MRQSSEFYLSIAKKQQNLLEQFKNTSKGANIGIRGNQKYKVEMSLPSLEAKIEDENPYQNLLQGNLNLNFAGYNDASIEDGQIRDPNYDTKKILGETRYKQKNQSSTRGYMQAYKSVNNYKEQLGSDCMQKKHWKSLSDNLSDLEDKYRSQKKKLEHLKEKLDLLMGEIEAWSTQRRQIERNTQQQKELLEKELEETIKERSQLKENMDLNEEKFNAQIDNIMQELDHLRMQISEKKKVNKALKIREEIINFRINPMKQELEELKESKTIFQDNMVQIEEVNSQWYEEYQMSSEDRIGKMLSRVDLVAEIEEYEELIENLKWHYSPEEVDFILRHINRNDKDVVKEFGGLREFWFLKEVWKSLKTKIQKDQDLEASMLSEKEFKLHTQTVDKLEELETIIEKRLPILNKEEIIDAVQSIWDWMDIKMKIEVQTNSISEKAGKRYEIIKRKVVEIKNEIDKTDNYIRENINTVENFIVPNISALEETLGDLENSKLEIISNIEEVTQAIEELEAKIQEVISEQSDKLDPYMSEVSMEECEQELELMSDKIKKFEDEIKGNGSL